MDKVTTVGIDLAKRVFALHGVDASGRVVLRKTIRREQFVETVAKLPPCLIGMEACSGSHEWARRFQALGHTVRLMAPVFVVPYRKSGKNDGNDAEAICEAVSRPNMRFVPVKSAEQQALLALHRVRQGFIEERTALINRLRAVLTEFGVVLPNRTQWVRRDAVAVAEPLPVLARQAVEDLRAHLRRLDERIGAYDRQLEQQARQSEAAMRLMQVRRIGPLTAVAIVATVGSARDFASGRQFAAWLAPGSASELLGRQGTPGPHQPTWRCVPAHAARAGRPLGTQHRRTAYRSPVTLGAVAPGASRYAQGSGGHRRQECAHRLGAAQQRSNAAHGLIDF